MFLIDCELGSQRLPQDTSWLTALLMAPDLIAIHQHKSSLPSHDRELLQSCSPVPGPDHLARLHHTNLAPLSADVNGKMSRPSKLKVRKSPAKLHSSYIDDFDMADADDKKRNKLGYQRISIACAHCRRRKIRCLVAEGDPQHRCQNCIRLKKECLFYPVDQQSAMESRPDTETKSRHGSAHTPSVSMSPPSGTINGRVDSVTHGFPGYSDMSDASNGYHGIPITPNGPYTSSAPYPPSDYSFHSPGAPPTPWSLPDEHRPFEQAIPVAAPNSLHPSFVRYGNVNMSPEFSPYPGALDPEHSSVPRAGSMMIGQAGERTSWSHQQHQPVRSMSYPDYADDGVYGARYLSNPSAQPLGAYPGQPALQIPTSAGMHMYGQPDNYTFANDQRSTSIPGLPGQSSPSAQSQWFQHGRQEVSQPLLSPQ